jgi:hypothetical protein
MNNRFAFLDASDAARKLGIDRVTLEQYVKDGRLKAKRGVGKEDFFRANDIEALYRELHPEAELAAAIAQDEAETVAAPVTKPAVKKQDPPMRVYLRLQADAKWYDISENDIQLWFNQVDPDGYERNKRNALHAIKKLQHLVNLIEAGQQRAGEI